MRDHGKKRSSPPVFLKNWLNFRVRGQFEIKIVTVQGHSDLTYISCESLEKINLSLRSFVTGNLSANNFKRILDLDGWTLEPAVRSGDTGQQIPCFDSCQLMTTVMCNQLSWAPKVARKCESKHWYACGPDGRSIGQSVGRSRDQQIARSALGAPLLPFENNS